MLRAEKLYQMPQEDKPDLGLAIPTRTRCTSLARVRVILEQHVNPVMFAKIIQFVGKSKQCSGWFGYAATGDETWAKEEETKPEDWHDDEDPNF